VNLLTGEYTGSTNEPSLFDIQPAAYGWWRVSLNASHQTGSYNAIHIAPWVNPTPTADPVYTGDGRSGIYIWQPQHTNGLHLTAPIFTTGTAVTRLGSDLSLSTLTANEFLNDMSMSGSLVLKNYLRDNNGGSNYSSNTMLSSSATYGLRGYHGWSLVLNHVSGRTNQVNMHQRIESGSYRDLGGLSDSAAYGLPTRIDFSLDNEWVGLRAGDKDFHGPVNYPEGAIDGLTSLRIGGINSGILDLRLYNRGFTSAEFITLKGEDKE